jgi:hypothetical protein
MPTSVARALAWLRWAGCERRCIGVRLEAGGPRLTVFQPRPAPDPGQVTSGITQRYFLVAVEIAELMTAEEDTVTTA